MWMANAFLGSFPCNSHSLQGSTWLFMDCATIGMEKMRVKSCCTWLSGSIYPSFFTTVWHFLAAWPPQSHCSSEKWPMSSPWLILSSRLYFSLVISSKTLERKMTCMFMCLGGARKENLGSNISLHSWICWSRTTRGVQRGVKKDEGAGPRKQSTGTRKSDTEVWHGQGSWM